MRDVDGDMTVASPQGDSAIVPICTKSGVRGRDASDSPDHSETAWTAGLDRIPDFGG